LYNEMSQHADNMPNGMASDIVLIQAHLDSMQEQISYLKTVIQTRDEEIRRKDHLLAAALERLPELQAPQDTPSEPRESPQTASEEPSGPRPQEEERRSWWQRLFGL
jgi:hypothetical protein